MTVSLFYWQLSSKGSFTKYVRAEVGRTGSRNTYDLVREKVGGRRCNSEEYVHIERTIFFITKRIYGFFSILKTNTVDIILERTKI